MKARWIGVGQNGKTADWAGDGTCTVLQIDEGRPGFGEDKGPGPACLVQFNTRHKLTEWIPLGEIEQDEAEEAT